jgi:hypothetical protein
MRRAYPFNSIVLCFAAVVACDRGGTTALGPRTAQGLYGLESTSGRGAASGTVVLSADGTAERRARYSQTGGGVSAEYVARGTFQVGAGGTVDLQLREDDGRSSYVWRPRAVLIGAVLELRYPDPGDGPDIVESYRRL